MNQTCQDILFHNAFARLNRSGRFFHCKRLPIETASMQIDNVRDADDRITDDEEHLLTYREAGAGFKSNHIYSDR